MRYRPASDDPPPIPRLGPAPPGPMTDERLTLIRAWVNHPDTSQGTRADQVNRELLAEVDRLKERIGDWDRTIVDQTEAK